MEKEKEYFKEHYRKLKKKTKNFIRPKKRKYIELKKRIKNPIISLKYYRELKKKINLNSIIISSILIIISYYLFKDAILSIINTIVHNFNNKYALQLNYELFIKIPNIFYLILLFYFIVFCKKHITSKNINIIDKAIIYSIIFSLVSLLVVKIKNEVFLIFISFLFILIIRFIFYTINNKEKNINNIRTLGDIYNGDYCLIGLVHMIIKDSDKIREDLFERNQIIDNLCYSIITSIDSIDCFTIGVVGNWGSGKSTILELTKKAMRKKFLIDYDLVIIDDFDPWAIKSQDSLILAMYNTIMENLGKNIGYFKRKKVQNALINISTSVPYIGKGIGNYFENRIDDYSEYKEIKNELEEKLKKSNKHFVFIIDNLDRINSDNIIFLLTLIETLFKLPRITYIVAYDKDRLKDIFNKKTDKIDPQYIEKIINKEIKVPEISNLEKQRIFYDCLKNLMVYDSDYKCNSSISNQKIEEINNDILTKVALKFNNTRDFIRFLNFIIYDILFTLLNRLDFLIIKLIEFLDYQLYNKISKNKNFITSKVENINYCTEKEIAFFKEIKESEFFDLLQLLSLKSTNFYNLVKDSPEEKNPICDINSEILRDSICNNDSFEDYFSSNIFTKEYKELIQYFKLANNVEYNIISEFFNKNNKYLEYYYLNSLWKYLLNIISKKDSSTEYFRMGLFCYFINKSKTYLYCNNENKSSISSMIDQIFRLIFGLIKEFPYWEHELFSKKEVFSSKEIKQFLEKLEYSYDSEIYRQTMQNIENMLKLEETIYNKELTDAIKIALKEIENDKNNIK